MDLDTKIQSLYIQHYKVMGAIEVLEKLKEELKEKKKDKK